jgi:hypothetical protein
MRNYGQYSLVLQKSKKSVFELLERAYIEARYNDDYEISKEQLLVFNW